MWVWLAVSKRGFGAVLRTAKADKTDKFVHLWQASLTAVTWSYFLSILDLFFLSLSIFVRPSLWFFVSETTSIPLLVTSIVIAILFLFYITIPKIVSSLGLFAEVPKTEKRFNGTYMCRRWMLLMGFAEFAFPVTYDVAAARHNLYKEFAIRESGDEELK